MGDTEKVVFKSGASRSDIKPRYDLIPAAALRRLAERYAMGAIKHGDKNWLKGHLDPEFRQQCVNHLVDHLYHWLENPNDTDDDLAAVAWGAFAMMQFEHMDQQVQ